jgi:hypothetical protein
VGCFLDVDDSAGVRGHHADASSPSQQKPGESRRLRISDFIFPRRCGMVPLF